MGSAALAKVSALLSTLLIIFFVTHSLAYYINAKCLPALYYGLEACPVNKSQIRSLEYVLNNTFRKFATESFDVATECVLYFGCAVQETLL